MIWISSIREFSWLLWWLKLWSESWDSRLLAKSSDVLEWNPWFLLIPLTNFIWTIHIYNFSDLQLLYSIRLIGDDAQLQMICKCCQFVTRMIRNIRPRDSYCCPANDVTDRLSRNASSSRRVTSWVFCWHRILHPCVALFISSSFISFLSDRSAD